MNIVESAKQNQHYMPSPNGLNLPLPLSKYQSEANILPVINSARRQPIEMSDYIIHQSSNINNYKYAQIPSSRY